MRESWSEFASNSTLHGLRHTVGVLSWPRRLFWVLCMLTAFGAYVYFVKESIEEFASKPISTHISHEYPKGGIFLPKITICNNNAVVKSKASIGYNDKRFKSLKLNLPACDIVRNISGNLTCGQALVCAYHKYGTDIFETCDSNMADILRNALNTSSRVFDPEEFLRVYGHDIETMVVSYCQYSSNYRCSTKDFQPVLTPKGLCYEFMPTKEDGRPPRVFYAGFEGGLGIVLDTQIYEDTFGDFSTGFLVVVSQYGEVANRNRGFSVYPGSSANAILFPKVFKRLPAPYKTNCSERYLPGYPLYTKDACVAQCFNNATIAACGCRLQGEPEHANIPACACSVPCKDRRFKVRVSYSKFPNEVGISVVQKKYGLNRSDDYIRKNLVFLQIGLAELGFVVEEQVAAYGASSLFGDIGGNMGLLLGCSLLTVVEFLDYICFLLLDRVRGEKKTINNLHNNDQSNSNVVSP